MTRFDPLAEADSVAIGKRSGRLTLVTTLASGHEATIPFDRVTIDNRTVRFHPAGVEVNITAFPTPVRKWIARHAGTEVIA